MATPGSSKRRLSSEDAYTGPSVKRVSHSSYDHGQNQEVTSSPNPTPLFLPSTPPASAQAPPSLSYPPLRHPDPTHTIPPPFTSSSSSLPPLPSTPTAHDRKYVDPAYSHMKLSEWMLEQKRMTYWAWRSESLEDRHLRIERKTKTYAQELPKPPTEVFVWGESADGEYYFARRWLVGPTALESMWEKYNSWERKYDSFRDAWELCTAFTQSEYVEGLDDPDVEQDESDDDEDVDSLLLENQGDRPMFLPVRQRERYAELAVENRELTRGDTYMEANLALDFRSIQDHIDRLLRLLKDERNQTLKDERIAERERCEKALTDPEKTPTNPPVDAKPQPVSQRRRDIAWLRMGLENKLHKVRISNTSPPWLGIIVRILKGHRKGADAKIIDVLPLRTTFTGIELVLEVLDVAGTSSSLIMDLDDVCLIEPPYSGQPLAIVFPPTHAQRQNFPLLNRNYLKWAQRQLGRRHINVVPKPLIIPPRPTTPPPSTSILSSSDRPLNRSTPPLVARWSSLLSMADRYIETHGPTPSSSSGLDWHSALSSEEQATILATQSQIGDEAIGDNVPKTHWLYPEPLRTVPMHAMLDKKVIRVRASLDVNNKLQIFVEDQGNRTLSKEEASRLRPHCTLRGSHTRLLVIRGPYIGKYVRRVVKSNTKDTSLTVCLVLRGNHNTSDEWISDERITLLTGDVTSDWEPQRERDASSAFVKKIIANYPTS